MGTLFNPPKPPAIPTPPPMAAPATMANSAVSTTAENARKRAVAGAAASGTNMTGGQGLAETKTPGATLLGG